MAFMRRMLPLSVVLAAVSMPLVGHAQDFDSVNDSTAAGAANPEVQLRRLWADFNHYVRIYRTDLAHAAVTSLLEQVEDQELLDIVEASEYRDYDQTLLRAMKVETLRDVTQTLADRLQKARIERSREPGRIMADIRRLAQGPRANMLATERLRAAGQYAAPFLLQTLLDYNEAKLHPYVLAAMVSIGRPMVYPLSVALPKLEPVPMGQIAQVLAEIGYPRSLPYLKMVLENQDADPTARNIVQNAYNKLASSLSLPDNVTAAELFLTLSRNLYEAATHGEIAAGYDAAIRKGIVWEYRSGAGLIAIQVPGQIFGDVMAMKAGLSAMQLDPKLDPALSLWLAANLRRENRLNPGEIDLSYSASYHAPAFYIRMAGPLRQHDVLSRALADHDTALALDAIAALRDTAGTDALINREGAAQPLLDALSYPDRRVRFNAAFAMANARPQSEFPGSHRVVTVLSEAVRQTENRYALVLAKDQETTNRLKATLEELGYTAFGGSTIEHSADQLNSGPGVDLIVMHYTGADVFESLFQQSAMHYKLAAVPVLALASSGDQIELNRRFGENKRFFTSLMSEDSTQLQQAVALATKSYGGQPIDGSEAEDFALQALTLLRELALDADNMLHPGDAQPALIQALSDDREQVVTHAADVLALLSTVEAQQAIGEAALDTTRNTEVQVSLLRSLSQSANNFGSKLTPIQLEALLELIKNSRDELAEAAAQAHGALTLPTANLVQMLTTN